MEIAVDEGSICPEFKGIFRLEISTPWNSIQTPWAQGGRAESQAKGKVRTGKGRKICLE